MQAIATEAVAPRGSPQSVRQLDGEYLIAATSHDQITVLATAFHDGVSVMLMPVVPIDESAPRWRSGRSPNRRSADLAAAADDEVGAEADDRVERFAASVTDVRDALAARISSEVRARIV